MKKTFLIVINKNKLNIMIQNKSKLLFNIFHKRKEKLFYNYVANIENDNIKKKAIKLIGDIS